MATSSLIQAIKDFERIYLDGKEFQGSICVVDNGEETLKYGCGKKLSMPIGSITKVFTAVAIFQLIERGDIALTTKAMSLLGAEFKSLGSITISHLLNHESGLGDYLYDLKNNYDIEKNEVIDIILKTPKLFLPGEKQFYSNSGFYILGLIIEKVTNQCWDSYIRKHILIPSKMQDTHFSKLAFNEVAKVNDKLEVVTDIPLDIMFSAGKLSSSTDDLVRFSDNLTKFKLLKEHSFNAYLINNEKNNGFFKYAHGGLGHSGDTLAFSSDFIFSNDGSKVVAIISSIKCVEIRDLSSKLFAIISGKLIDRDTRLYSYDSTYMNKLKYGRYTVNPVTKKRLFGVLDCEHIDLIQEVLIEKYRKGIKISFKDCSSAYLRQLNDLTFLDSTNGISLEFKEETNSFILSQSNVYIDYFHKTETVVVQ